jgi:hypothetical protein
MQHKSKNNMPRVLFICKNRIQSYGVYGYGASYGLLNSCRFLVNALRHMGVEAKTVEVADNNCIDREVSKYKPTHVFIEALWVVPSKFDILIKLHPYVQWNVRLHSNTPFLANEGIAMEWIKAYAKLQDKYPQFNIAPNSIRMADDLLKSLGIPTIYAPNIYQPYKDPKHHEHYHNDKKDDCIIDIGCYGAIRPLKNHLIQAMAAMTFANELGKSLHFHINYSRVESHGENAYKNLVKLFKDTPHKLVHHEWMEHDKFLKIVNEMDLGLQVSFSETFNIVAADFAYLNVPIVGSKEIEWMSSLYQANPTNMENIVDHLWMAWIGRKIKLQSTNSRGLDSYNTESKKVWKKLLGL